MLSRALLQKRHKSVSSSVEEGGAVNMGGAAGFRNQKRIRQGPLWLFRPEGIECNPQQLFYDFRLRKKSIHASSNTPGLRIGCNCSLFRLPLRASISYPWYAHTSLYISITHAQQACHYMFDGYLRILPTLQ